LARTKKANPDNLSSKRLKAMKRQVPVEEFEKNWLSVPFIGFRHKKKFGGDDTP
jgi:hypothetical protein